MTEQQTVAPGWYPDPEVAHAVRFWDGERWADQRVLGGDLPTTSVGPRFGTLGRAVVLGMTAAAAVLLVQAVVDVWGLVLLGDGLDGPSATPAYGDVQDVLAWVVFAVAAPTMVAWVVWQFQLARATPADHLRHEAGWHIAGWVIPVVNLWYPRSNLLDLWRNRLPGAPTGRLDAWWAAWITLLATQLVSEKLAEGSETAGGQRAALVLGISYALAGTAVAVLSTGIARRLTDRELSVSGPATPAG